MLNKLKRIFLFTSKDRSKKFDIREISGFVAQKFQEILDESNIIVRKLKDLHKTNYDLALKHIEKGNLKEAIFRLKIVKRFWPNDDEVYLKLLYCYLMLEEYYYIEKYQKILMSLDPKNISRIESLKKQTSFELYEARMKKESEELEEKKDNEKNDKDNIEVINKKSEV